MSAGLCDRAGPGSGKNCIGVGSLIPGRVILSKKICDQFFAYLGRFFNIKIVVADIALRNGLCIVAGVIDKDVAGKFHDPAGSPVDEITVMGNIQNGPVIGVEGIFQNFAGNDIQMVGRLVEDQQVGFGQHELCQRDTAFFTAGEFAYKLEYIVPGKEKGSQQVSDLCIGHGRKGVGNLFKNGITVVQDVMFLVVVADVDVGTKSDMSCVLSKQTVQDLQDGGLAGSVIADQSDMFSAPYVETQPGKQSVPVKGLGQTVDSQDFASASDAGRQFEVHVVTQDKGLFHDLHFAEHFFAALRAFNGLFPVKLLEFGDDLFLMTDLGLVVEPGTLLLVPEGFLFFGINGVIACKECGVRVFDLDHFGDRAVKKIAVVGDDEDSTSVVGEIVFQPADAAQIQMVGGLIEHDHIRTLQKQAGKGNAGLLSSG